MPASDSSIFTDADGYQASLRDLLDLLVLRPRDFHARLTWVEFLHLHLLYAEEAGSRLAYVTLPQEQVFIIFPTRRDSLLIAGGTELPFGAIMFHNPGSRFHQRTTAACHWGSISLSAESLRYFSRIIAGRELAPPTTSRVLRPHRAPLQRLLRLHATARRIAETSQRRITNDQVVRAMDQDLIWALIGCLTTAEKETGRQQISLSVQLEALLEGHPCRLLLTKDVCDALGVSEQTLRATCMRVLGMSPGRYQRLRRLKLVRSELRQAKPGTVDVAAVMERYGFSSLHRFVAEYWDAYGEVPPIPARIGASR